MTAVEMQFAALKRVASAPCADCTSSWHSLDTTPVDLNVLRLKVAAKVHGKK